MTKSTKASLGVVETEPQHIQIRLREFCTHLSVSDKRVEMIGAFFSEEKEAGREKDLKENYSSRYKAFVCRPVN